MDNAPDFFATGTPAQDSNADINTNGKDTTHNIVVDNIPYLVKIAPFTFNEEERFYVTVNNGIQHVMAWDTEMNAYRAVDDNSVELPDGLEVEISNQLISKR